MRDAGGRIFLAALLVAGLGWLGAGRGAAAATRGCGGLEALTPRVELVVEAQGRPRIEGASAAEIRSKAAGVGSIHGRSTTVRGLTATRLAGRASYTMSKATLPNGRECVALAGIKARFASEEVSVLFDRRYAEGSCERQAVLDHELEHVRISAETLREAEPRVREELRKVAGRWAGRWVDGREAARIDEEIDATLARMVREVEAEAGRRNARIDTPQSYQAVQRRCRRW